MNTATKDQPTLFLIDEAASIRFWRENYQGNTTAKALLTKDGSHLVNLVKSSVEALVILDMVTGKK